MTETVIEAAIDNAIPPASNPTPKQMAAKNK